MNVVRFFYPMSGMELFYQIVEDDNIIVTGSFSLNNVNSDYNFYGDYYFTGMSFYKLVDNVKVPVVCEVFFDYALFSDIIDYMGSSSDGFVVNDKFISFYDFKVPVAFYEKDGVLSFSSDNISYNDKKYKLELNVDVNILKVSFYIAEIVDGKDVFVNLNVDAIRYLFSRNVVAKLLHLENKTLGNKLSFVVNKINSLESSINKDFTDVNNYLKQISSKFDLLKVLDISKMIDDKLTQIFNLHSLNGSNGSKFKDGSIVKIKGYDGDWKVEGSYPLLNSDGVTIIVYKVVQDGRVLLAPSPFVGV